jgi:hypothetical protein
MYFLSLKSSFSFNACFLFLVLTKADGFKVTGGKNNASMLQLYNSLITKFFLAVFNGAPSWFQAAVQRAACQETCSHRAAKSSPAGNGRQRRRQVGINP